MPSWGVSVKRAYFLVDKGRALDFQSASDGITLQLGDHPIDPVATVVVLETTVGASLGGRPTLTKRAP